jgi:hypothetical protein
MKNIKLKIVIIFYLSLYNCFAQNITFTDNVFKNLLVSIQANHGRASNLQNQSTKIDTNNDGEIQISEAMNIKTISLDNSNLTNLTGLEHFKKLTQINLNNNQITSFQFPTLIDLEYINFSINPIASVNLSLYPKLTSIGLLNNPITQVDVSALPMLQIFTCQGTPITTLDFRNNPNLVHLGFKNSSVSTVYFHANSVLNLTSSAAVNDCWSNAPLTYICAGASQITPITTFLTNCGHNLSNITINSTCALNVNNYDKEIVKIYPNPSTTGIFTIKLPNVHTGEVAVFNTLGQVVFQKYYNEQQEITLNISQLSKGIYLAKITNATGSSYEEKLVVE